MPLLEGASPSIRTSAAEALFNLGKEDLASKALIADVTSKIDSSSLLYLLNTLRRLSLLDKLPKDWSDHQSMQEGSQGYIKRFSQRAMK